MQNEKGKVLLKIEQNLPECLKALKIELGKYFHKDVDFEIRWGEKLHVMNGKLKKFITTLY